MAETHTQRPERLNVWAGICRGRIIGSFFLPPILNGESYLNLLVHSVGPSLDAIAGEDPIWFQHRWCSAPLRESSTRVSECHISGTWIGRRGAQEWPPRSPDLNPLDFFYWGYLKSKVYINRPENLEELRQSIGYNTRSAG